MGLDPLTAAFNCVTAFINYRTALINRAPPEAVGKILEAEADRMNRFGAWVEEHLGNIGKKDQ